MNKVGQIVQIHIMDVNSFLKMKERLGKREEKYQQSYNFEPLKYQTKQNSFD